MTNFPLQPVGFKIIVLPQLKKEQKYKGTDLVIPETANADLQTGKVVAVSEELSAAYQVGDVVLFPERVGVGQLINGQPHLWLDVKAEHVWGKDLSAE